jgi:hypothetical protein
MLLCAFIKLLKGVNALIEERHTRLTERRAFAEIPSKAKTVATVSLVYYCLHDVMMILFAQLLVIFSSLSPRKISSARFQVSA